MVPRYRVSMTESVDFTISFEPPDKAGWIVACVLEVPGAMSQGRTRDEARKNALDALRTVLTPDEELAGQASKADHEHLRFTAAAEGRSWTFARSAPNWARPRRRTPR
jgi:predicted RNase H-like HicB family nuclease